jgi:hypothetical protein
MMRGGLLRGQGEQAYQQRWQVFSWQHGSSPGKNARVMGSEYFYACGRGFFLSNRE